MVSGDKWTATQKERMRLVFERYPDLEEAYSLVHSLRMIFSNPRATWISGYESIQKWYQKVKAFGGDAFNTTADTIRDREDEVLNISLIEPSMHLQSLFTQRQNNSVHSLGE